MNEAVVLMKLLFSATLFIIVLRYFLRPKILPTGWIKQWDWHPGYYDPRVDGVVHIADMKTDSPARSTMVLITGKEGFTGEGEQGVYRLSVTGTSYDIRRITPHGQKVHLQDLIVPQEQFIDNIVQRFWDGMARNLAEV